MSIVRKYKLGKLLDNNLSDDEKEFIELIDTILSPSVKKDNYKSEDFLCDIYYINDEQIRFSIDDTILKRICFEKYHYDKLIDLSYYLLRKDMLEYINYRLKNYSNINIELLDYCFYLK